MLSACAFVACTRAGGYEGKTLPTPDSPPIPPSLYIPATLYDIRAEVAPLDESKILPEPLGLPSLRSSPLPSGVREIRIYTGLVIGYPHSALIVHDDKGNVTGRLVRYWPRNDTAFTDTTKVETMFEATEAGRCSTPVHGKTASVCTVTFLHEPDWRALLVSLDGLNAWKLPDESRVPKSGMMFDGWVIRAEARQDTTYVRYQYHNPQIYRPPEGANALRLMLMVDSLFRFTKPPANLQYVRGIFLFGRDTLDFSPCHEPAMNGWFVGTLGPLGKVVGDSAWNAHAGPTKSYYVEAWVHRGDRPTTYYKRTLPRTWGADSITVARPALSNTCGVR